MPPRGSHNISFTAEEVSIVPRGYREITINASSVDPGEVIDTIDVDQIISIIGTGPLLDRMSIKDVIDHFGQDEIFEHLDIDPKFQLGN